MAEPSRPSSMTDKTHRLILDKGVDGFMCLNYVRKVHRDSTYGAHSISGTKLPLELLRNIAFILEKSDQRRTLSNLNACSKTLHSIVNPILFRKLALKDDSIRGVLPQYDYDSAGVGDDIYVLDHFQHSTRDVGIIRNGLIKGFRSGTFSRWESMRELLGRMLESDHPEEELAVRDLYGDWEWNPLSCLHSKIDGHPSADSIDSDLIEAVTYEFRYEGSLCNLRHVERITITDCIDPVLTHEFGDYLDLVSPQSRKQLMPKLQSINLVRIEKTGDDNYDGEDRESVSSLIGRLQQCTSDPIHLCVRIGCSDTGVLPAFGEYAKRCRTITVHGCISNACELLADLPWVTDDIRLLVEDAGSEVLEGLMAALDALVEAILHVTARGIESSDAATYTKILASCSLRVQVAFTPFAFDIGDRQTVGHFIREWQSLDSREYDLPPDVSATMWRQVVKQLFTFTDANKCTKEARLEAFRPCHACGCGYQVFLDVAAKA